MDETKLLWGALMLAHKVETCDSILGERPVMARQLDARALRRGLRGAPLPRPTAYVTVSAEMLLAVEEAGPFAEP